MIKIREANGHVHTLERHRNGMYEVRIRSGVTLISKCMFDSGREAHRAYKLSAERFMREYDK